MYGMYMVCIWYKVGNRVFKTMPLLPRTACLWLVNIGNMHMTFRSGNANVNVVGEVTGVTLSPHG